MSEERSGVVGELHHTDALTLSAIWKLYHQRGDYSGYLERAAEDPGLTHPDFEVLATELLRRRGMESAPSDWSAH